MDKRSVKHALQDRAELDAAIQTLRVEGRELLKPGITRTAAQEQRVAAIDAEITTLTARAAEVATELVRFGLAREEEIASGGFDRQGSARPPGRRFAEMFPDAGASMGGWGSASEFLTVIGNGLHDARLMAASMSGGTGSGGGFAIPPGVLGPWLDAALESEIVRPRANVWPMTTDERTVPAWDVTDRSGDDLAGFEIQWTPELGTMDLQVGKIRRIKLKARKGAILAEASNELSADGLDFDGQLNRIMVKALSYGLDKSFLFGAGGNQPLGALVSAARITVAKEGGQAAGTIYYDNIAKMFARMDPASIANSVWLANPTTIPKLLTLALPVGTGGLPYPVLNEDNGKWRMLTRPVIFSEKMKTVGTEGDLALVDLSQYSIGLRSDIVIDKSTHVGFTRDAVSFRLKVRLDGQPNISEPYTLPNQAGTVSPFVTLATRA